MAKNGDIVRFLNAVGGGRVVRVDGQMVYVEDEDGFEVPCLARECVVVAEAGSDAARSYAVKNQQKPSDNTSNKSKSAKAEQPAHEFETIQTLTKIVEPDPDIVIEETDHGDKINVIIAFEPSDLQHLDKSTWDCMLVNDSNYYLSFVFATRSDNTQQWTLRRAGVVEPNIVLSLAMLTQTDLTEIDRINLQFTAYKEDKPWSLKRPVSVIHRLDATKFYKLHCYTDNIYFDTEVLSLDIVKDDEPYRSAKPDARQIETAMRQKRNLDMQPRRQIVRRSEPRREGEAIVVDLHIDELVDSTRGLSAADMLNLQVDEFRRVMDANLHNKGQKIIFIHGKGEGVLRRALTKELNYRYKTHQVEDAPFKDFGAGATMVIIR